MILELAGIFGMSLAVAFSGALMPGPLFTLTVADSARRGFISGPLLMTGHALLELALVACILLGLGPALEAPVVLGVIAAAGGGIMLWMGQSMVRSAAGMSLSLDASGANGGAGSHPVLTGVLASLSNPYWILWWATIGLGYLVSAQKLGWAGVAVFFVGHISADFIWYSVVSLAVSSGRRIMSDPAYRAIIRFCGFLLVFFASVFLYAAGRQFLGWPPFTQLFA